ncbi:MAG: transposase [Verrucomicrobia bacterium]|nr:transposase [Verrucomicrobiota bacterium]
MATTLVKINIHLIFHIKSISVTMRQEYLERIFSYIAGIIKGLEGMPIQIGGVNDHIHILASMPKTISLADFVRSIKIESNKWIKTLDISYIPFAWQDGYGAFSVSASQVEKTAQYIRKQAEHHTKHSFTEEYKMFLDAYGIQYDKRYAFRD